MILQFIITKPCLKQTVLPVMMQVALEDSVLFDYQRSHADFVINEVESVRYVKNFL